MEEVNFLIGSLGDLSKIIGVIVLPLHHLFINLFNIYLWRVAMPWTEDKIANKTGE